MSARARSQDKAVAWAKGSQVRRQLPYSARRHPQQPPPCVQLVVQCLRVQVVTCSGCPFLDAHQERETVLDLEQADFSAAHLREVLQQRHDLLLEDEVILVALGPGTTLSAQLDLALDDRVRGEFRLAVADRNVSDAAEVDVLHQLDESPLRWGEVCFVDLCHCQSPCSEVLARPVANPVLTNKKRRIAPSLGKALHPALQWLHLA